MFTVTELPHIPLEVAENMIDNLSRDVCSLRSCALTCHGWYLRARSHLMTSIRIHSRGDLFAIHDFFTSNPHLRSLVRSLTISPAITESNPLLLLEALPVLLLSLLPNLRRYSIQHSTGDTMSSGISFHAVTLGRIKRYLLVDELSLGPLAFRTGAELARLLISLPQLRRLECTRVHFVDQGNLSGSGAGMARFHNKCSLLSEVKVRQQPWGWRCRWNTEYDRSDATDRRLCGLPHYSHVLVCVGGLAVRPGYFEWIFVRYVVAQLKRYLR